MSENFITHSLKVDKIAPPNEKKEKKGFFQKIKNYLEAAGYLYAAPLSMSYEDWQEWEQITKASHPIQYYFRNEFCYILSSLKRRLEDKLYMFKQYFNPPNSIVRKALEDGYDIAGLVIPLNFALILQFREELKNDIVNWDSTEGHIEFKAWFEEAVRWITIERPQMEKDLDNAYPVFSSTKSDKTYEELYGEVNRIESAIEATDTQVINKLMKYRSYMWT
jgi:hypothetical protein